MKIKKKNVELLASLEPIIKSIPFKRSFITRTTRNYTDGTFRIDGNVMNDKNEKILKISIESKYFDITDEDE